jgi:hypothetical protein
LTELELVLLAIVFVLLMFQIVLGTFLLSFFRSMKERGIHPADVMNKNVPFDKSEVKFDRENQQSAFTGVESPLDLEIIKGRTDIKDSVDALSRKYHLVSITLAYRDGSVIASSLDETDEKAAHYSYLYFNGIEPQNRMVRLFGVENNGDEIAFIVRLQRDIPDEWFNAIINEVNDILAWWL